VLRSGLRRQVSATIAVVAVGIAGCGNGDSGPPYPVAIDEVSHETTQEMAVFAPDTDGSWPVVFLYHGAGDTWENVAELAEQVAEQGRVVIAITYRSNDRTGGTRAEIEPDTECGYRYGRSIADDYGGDLDQPVTAVGHSLGATVITNLTLMEDLYGPDGAFDACFDGAPRPDAIVSVAGCHRSNGLGSLSYKNEDATVDLIATSDDQNCPVVESEYALDWFTDHGYDATLQIMGDANHFSPIFHDKVEGEWILLPDHPAGLETVQVILNAGEAVT
jgi:dienelactone hydrolase